MSAYLLDTNMASELRKPSSRQLSRLGIPAIGTRFKLCLCDTMAL
jgi:predicted nucleic acid-binding protein